MRTCKRALAPHLAVAVAALAGIEHQPAGAAAARAGALDGEEALAARARGRRRRRLAQAVGLVPGCAAGALAGLAGQAAGTLISTSAPA